MYSSIRIGIHRNILWQIPLKHSQDPPIIVRIAITVTHVGLFIDDAKFCPAIYLERGWAMLS